jgi:hypothetical protein
MRTPIILLGLIVLIGNSYSFGEDLGTLVFQDNFERVESQQEKDEPGNGWNTNSRSRAKGNKQVDLRDGAMRIFIHEAADHAVSVTHPAEFTDGAVALRFMLEDGRDSLGLNFADLQYKPVHAGHLFVAKVSTRMVHLQDLKTGNMDLVMRQARQENTLTDAQKSLLKEKEVKFPHKLKTGRWYELLVKVEDDSLMVSIDDKLVGSFRSEGIAHPTKRLLRLAVPRNAVVDDVRIYRKK